MSAPDGQYTYLVLDMDAIWSGRLFDTFEDAEAAANVDREDPPGNFVGAIVLRVVKAIPGAADADVVWPEPTRSTEETER